MDIVIRSAVMVGMLAVVPLGLALVGGPGVDRVRRCWAPFACAGAASLWLPRGGAAVLLAGAYLVAAGALVACAVARALEGRRATPRELAVLTALVTPAVAAVALVAERAGVRLFGFELETLSLTVAHFHMAGFAAALVAGLVCRAERDDTAGRLTALAVPGGTALVLAGFFTGEWVELAGTLVLTAGMWGVAWLTWHDIRPRAGDRWTRVLLGTGAVTLAVTMVLAVSWALGEAARLPHLPLGWMAATHGLANAVAFAACGLVAWRRLGVAPL